MANIPNSSHDRETSPYLALLLSRVKTAEELTRGEPRLRRLLAYVNTEDSMITELLNTSRVSNSTKGTASATYVEQRQAHDTPIALILRTASSTPLSRPARPDLSKTVPSVERHQSCRPQPRRVQRSPELSASIYVHAGPFVPKRAGNSLVTGDNNEHHETFPFESSQQWIYDRDLERAGIIAVNPTLRAFTWGDMFEIREEEVDPSDSD